MGKEFNNADKGKTFKRGGDMAKTNPFMEMIAKKKAMAAGKKSEMPMKKSGMTKMAKGGSVDAGMSKTMQKVKVGSGIDGTAQKGKTRGKQFGIDGPKWPAKTTR